MRLGGPAWDDQNVKYVTRLERFESGDFPMVCVKSGRPATNLVPVEALKTSSRPWFLLPISLVAFLVSRVFKDRNRPWGLLPFADGEETDIVATYDPTVGVVVRDVHQGFIDAVKESQRRQHV